MERSGQQCNRCFRGRWRVFGVYSRAEYHTRYLRCDHCGSRSQQILEAADVVKRKTRAVKRTAGSAVGEKH